MGRSGYDPGMSVVARRADLWSVIRLMPTVDPSDLLAAVETECRRPPHDFRTQLLIRDSLRAVAGYWGEPTLRSRLSPLAGALRDQFESADLGEDRGFPTLMRRIMDRTKPEDIVDFLRQLSRMTRQPCRINVGGSASLLLRELIARHTADVDVVDEVPAILRTQYARLDELVEAYGLRLTHFQSHYLPDGWERRVELFGTFDELSVFLVSPTDVFVGKLFSHRVKDLADLRMLRSQLSWPAVVDRLTFSTRSLRAEPRPLEAAEHNWYVLTGEERLPPPAD
jgi:hypothetical protein